jgi:hypothetical protein
VSGYDIIGDVHGCATALEELLHHLDYQVNDSTGAYEHPERQAIFVGDMVDRGVDQLRVLQIVKGMVDGGSAQIVMGNHEFNAIAYDTEHPDRPGEYLRPRNEKNAKQHHAFLEQLSEVTRAEYLLWFMSMPLWLNLGDIRIVHACWHEPSMRVVEEALGSNRFTSLDQFVPATTKGHPLYEAIEVLLKARRSSSSVSRRTTTRMATRAPMRGSHGGGKARRHFATWPSWTATSPQKAENRTRHSPRSRWRPRNSPSAIAEMCRCSTATTGTAGGRGPVSTSPNALPAWTSARSTAASWPLTEREIREDHYFNVAG